MLLRICLILAILAGVGVIGVSQFMLRPQIEGIMKERQDNKEGWEKTTASLKKTNTVLKATIEKLAKTETTLEETKGQLATTTTKFETEQKRANGLQENVNKLTGDLRAARDDLAAWTNSGVRVDEIKGLVSTVKSLSGDNEALKEEVKLFKNKSDKAEKKLADVLGNKQEDPPIPREVRGKVLVVDPKWDFLVLDVGAKQEVPEKGVLLVSRNGELVAKIRVMNVQDQRCIANIMPGWKLKDVLEGDIVLPY